MVAFDEKTKANKKNFKLKKLDAMENGIASRPSGNIVIRRRHEVDLINLVILNF